MSNHVVQARSFDNTCVRFHDLALQRWLNGTFDVVEGYPVPVIFASPMDAFSEFARLWSLDNNPYRYLYEAKNEYGEPLYEPYPSNVRYPVISVSKSGWSYRPNQSTTYREWRPFAWVTVDENPSRQDVGMAMIRMRPSAWDYTYKIVFLCTRQDTQARFVQQFIDAMDLSASAAQTFVNVAYPSPGVVIQERLMLSGNIDDLTEREPGPDRPVIFQTGLTLTIEGFSVKTSWDEVPVLWQTALTEGSVPPPDLTQLYDFRRVSDEFLTSDLKNSVSLTNPADLRNPRGDGSIVDNK